MRIICGNCGWFVEKQTECGRKKRKVGWSSPCTACQGKYFVRKIGEKYGSSNKTNKR